MCILRAVPFFGQGDLRPIQRGSTGFTAVVAGRWGHPPLPLLSLRPALGVLVVMGAAFFLTRRTAKQGPGISPGTLPHILRLLTTRPKPDILKADRSCWQTANPSVLVKRSNRELGSYRRLLLFCVHDHDDQNDDINNYCCIGKQSLISNHIITSSPWGEETKEGSLPVERSAVRRWCANHRGRPKCIVK